MWLFATIEVCSRLWASSLVGRRSYRNTKAVLNDVILRGRLVGIPLIATDGLLRGDRSPHGYRLRLRSSDQDSAEQSCRPSRTARQDRHDESLGGSTVGVGGFREPERAHTSFVERLNLTIRQGSAYLRRRSPCHARCADRLRWHVELLRCHYNFVRPHSALKFGRETRTPAMQAGLVSTPMNWNERLHGTRSLSTYFCDGRAHSGSGPAHRNWRSRAADVLMAARSKKGCLINSEWRKHPFAGGKTWPRGYSSRSKSGPVSGPQPSSGVEATGIRSLCCAMWPTGWIGSVFP